jgi:hypothetical protein
VKSGATLPTRVFLPVSCDASQKILIRIDFHLLKATYDLTSWGEPEEGKGPQLFWIKRRNFPLNPATSQTQMHITSWNSQPRKDTYQSSMVSLWNKTILHAKLRKVQTHPRLIV